MCRQEDKDGNRRGEKKNRLEPPSRRPISSETPTGLEASSLSGCRKSRHFDNKLSESSATVGESDRMESRLERRLLHDFRPQGLVHIDLAEYQVNSQRLRPSSCNSDSHRPRFSPRTVARVVAHDRLIGFAQTETRPSPRPGFLFLLFSSAVVRLSDHFPALPESTGIARKCAAEVLWSGGSWGVRCPHY